MKSNIGWTEYTWNPYLWKCKKVSQGCKNCYMYTLATRHGQNPAGEFGTRWEAAMKELRGFKPGGVVFVNSMSDTYYEAAPDADVIQVHNTIASRPDLTFLVLTKRPERAYWMRHALAWPDNLWLGVTTEANQYVEKRLDMTIVTPAKHVFVSAEPLLSSLPDLTHYLRNHYVHWVICGGESGANRRPMNKDWAREIRNVCAHTSVPFFYKQGNSFKPGKDRLLDGREWNQFPSEFSVEGYQDGTEPANDNLATIQQQLF